MHVVSFPALHLERISLADTTAYPELIDVNGVYCCDILFVQGFDLGVSVEVRHKEQNVCSIGMFCWNKLTTGTALGSGPWNSAPSIGTDVQLCAQKADSAGIYSHTNKLDSAFIAAGNGWGLNPFLDPDKLADFLVDNKLHLRVELLKVDGVQLKP